MTRALLKELLVALVALSLLLGVAGFGMREADRKKNVDEVTAKWRSAFSDIVGRFRETGSNPESGYLVTPCRGSHASISDVVAQRTAIEQWSMARICLAFGVMRMFPRNSWVQLNLFAADPLDSSERLDTLSRILSEPEVQVALRKSQLFGEGDGEQGFWGFIRRLDMQRADSVLSDLEKYDVKENLRDDLRTKDSSAIRDTWSGVLDEVERVHLAHLQALERQAIAETASIGALLIRPFVNWPRRLCVTLLFVGAVTVAIMIVAHLMVVGEIQQSPTRSLIFLLSMPTFVVSLGLIETLGIRSVPPYETPLFWRYLVGFLCLVLASGILFEVVQVFQSTARKELNSSHVAGLKTFGVTRGSRERPLAMAKSLVVILRYFGSTLEEVIRGRRAVDASASRKAADGSDITLPPLFFRALAYHDLELVKRRFSYLLDSMIVVAILFGLHDTVVGGFVDSVAVGGLNGLLELVVGVVVVGTVFRLLGTIIWYRLFA